MHLVGFTIELYYDARPYGRQIIRYLFLVILPRNKLIAVWKLTVSLLSMMMALCAQGRREIKCLTVSRIGR